MPSTPNKLKIFILDDQIDRYPWSKIQDILSAHNLTLARNYEEGTKIFNGNYDLLILDYDLGKGLNGAKFVDWLLEQTFQKFPDVIVHSWGAAVEDLMVMKLRRHGFIVAQVPFGLRLIGALQMLVKEYEDENSTSSLT